MDQVEIYPLLFTDTLVSNLVFITTPELIFHTMKKFGLHNGYLVVFVSSLAFTISIFLNYLFGIICYKILLPFSKEESKIIEQRVSNIRNNKYTPLVLICAAIPFWGKFIILFAGLCRVSFFTTIAIGVFAKFIYYSLAYIVL